MVWLVLCDPTDVAARWAQRGLERHGIKPVYLVTSDDLAHARWEHYVTNEGVRATVSLRDGRILRTDAVRGTLNRLLYPPPGDMVLIRPSDRTYVFHELMAIFMSWLAALPGPILNGPSPECLCGRIRSPAEWFCLAGRAGLPVSRLRLSSDDQPALPSLQVRTPSLGTELTTLLVVGETVVGPAAPAAICDAAIQLASIAQMSLLGLDFLVESPDAWKLVGVTSMPDLRLGGDAFLEALASHLRDWRSAAL